MHICMFKVAYGAAGISCMSVSSRYNTQKYFCMHAAVCEAPRDFISVSSLTNAIGGEREGKELEKKTRFSRYFIPRLAPIHQKSPRRIFLHASVTMLPRIQIFQCVAKVPPRRITRGSVTLVVIVRGIMLPH